MVWSEWKSPRIPDLVCSRSLEACRLAGEMFVKSRVL